MVILEYFLKYYRDLAMRHNHFVIIKLTINTYSWYQKHGQMWMTLNMFMNSKVCLGFLNALMVGTNYKSY
jgi:hypothetical protein